MVQIHILNSRFFYTILNPHCKYVLGTFYAAQSVVSDLNRKKDIRWLSLEACDPPELG
jgi:hypothetical protein